MAQYKRHHQHHRQSASPKTESWKGEVPGTAESRRNAAGGPSRRTRDEQGRAAAAIETEAPRWTAPPAQPQPCCHRILTEMAPALMDEQPIDLPPLSDHELYWDSIDEGEGPSRDDDDNRWTPIDEEMVPDPTETIPEPVPEPIDDEIAAKVSHDQTVVESETDASAQEPAPVPTETVLTDGVPEAVPAHDVESVVAEITAVPKDDVALKVDNQHPPDVDVKDPAGGQSEGDKVFIVTVCMCGYLW